MFTIATTRFNNDTLETNYAYRKKYGFACMYCCPQEMSPTIYYNTLVFVIEMNNQTNKIEGIGLIRNQLVLDKRYNVYSIGDYNRYIYKGDYWISRERLCYYDKELVDIFETILFKGKGHFKRQSGISVVSSLLFEKWEYDEEIIRTDLKNIFIKEFCSLNTDANEELNKETEEEYEYIYINNKNNNIKAI